MRFFTAEYAENAEKMQERDKDQLDLITRRIIGVAIEVHKGLGRPGYWNRLMRLAWGLNCASLDSKSNSNSHCRLFIRT